MSASVTVACPDIHEHDDGTISVCGAPVVVRKGFGGAFIFADGCDVCDVSFTIPSTPNRAIRDDIVKQAQLAFAKVNV